MSVNLYSKSYKKFLWAGMALVVIVTAGTAGYWVIGGGSHSFVDCLYMTFITLSTIGYTEVVDMSHNPAGRIFTMLIAISGIGTATYILTNLTAFMVEGELSEAFRRRKMEKMISKLRGHYIVCGVEGVGFYVLSELSDTGRPCVAVDVDRDKIDRTLEDFHDQLFIVGDATDSDTLVEAGIRHAKGVFAVTGDDNQNLVISLTAKQLNPVARVVARCQDLRNIEKMKKAGADAVVSPTFIGGLRMASEMVRSTVVTFLDTMLRDREKNLRIEEFAVPEGFAGRSIADMSWRDHPNTLLLAIKTEGDWIYNPSTDYILKSNDAIIFMTTPEERDKLEAIFSRGKD